MSKAHELGQLGHIVSVSDGISTTVSISGIVSATSFVGDGANLENTGAVVSAGATVGTQRVALTDITSGIMTSAATDSALVYESSTGTLSATSFSGDGANLSNTGAVVSAGSGTQRVALTDITSGIMTSAATDSALTYDSSTGTLSATFLSGDGSNITNAGSTLSAASGTERVVLTNLTSGAMTATSTDSNLTFDASTGTLSATSFSGDGSNLENTGAVVSSGATVGTRRVVLTDITSGIMTSAATNSSLTYDSATGILDASVFAGAWTIGADAGNTYYTFTGPGYDGTEQNPTIYLQRGKKYKFTNNMGAHPFRIQSNTLSTQYNDGLSANVVDNGDIIWDVQWDTPNVLYYECTSHGGMQGYIFISDPEIESGYQYSSFSGVHKASYQVGIGSLAFVTNSTFEPARVIGSRLGQYTIPSFEVRGELQVDGTIASKSDFMVLGISTYFDDSGTQITNPKSSWRTEVYANRMIIGSPMPHAYDWAQNRAPMENYVMVRQASYTAGNDTHSNVAIGRRALSGNHNVCLTPVGGPAGHPQLRRNVIIGAEANRYGGTGTFGDGYGSGCFDSVLIGSQVASGVRTPLQCVAIGAQAMYNNGSTQSSDSTITDHIAIGYRAGRNLRSVGKCVAVGREALISNSSGNGQNTCIGWKAGNSITSGENNTVLGHDADTSAVDVDNEITLGNASVATLRCQVTSITALSDRRDKANIENIPVGLNYINALRPVKFDWARRDGSYQGKKSFGFIAQELDEVQNQFGYKDYSNLVYESNPDKLEAAPMNSYPILVKAVQELSQQNQDLLRRIEELENRLNNE